MLRALILAGYDNSAWNMGNTDGRVRFIHMLAAGTRGSVGINPEILVIYFHFNMVVNLRCYCHRGKRGVSALIGIKR